MSELTSSIILGQHTVVTVTGAFLTQVSNCPNPDLMVTKYFMVDFIGNIKHLMLRSTGNGLLLEVCCICIIVHASRNGSPSIYRTLTVLIVFIVM